MVHIIKCTFDWDAYCKFPQKKVHLKLYGSVLHKNHFEPITVLGYCLQLHLTLAS